MGQGEMGGVIGRNSETGGIGRYRVIALLVLTALFVAVKAVGHDYWAVGFGLAMSSILLLTPQTTEHSEPWRGHALRVVSACFVVVTVASIWTTLIAGGR